MQSYSKDLASSVGHQHDYVNQGTVKALKVVYEKEGLRGLWRGVDAAMVRTGIGSAVQLSSYDLSKRFLLSTGLFEVNNGVGNVEVHFGASLITSFFVCLAMNPFDVASTRMVGKMWWEEEKRSWKNNHTHSFALTSVLISLCSIINE